MQSVKSTRKPWVAAVALFFIGLVVGGVIVSSSIGSSPTSSSTVNVTSKSGTPVLNVLATFFPLQDWAAAVGGDKANVSLLVPVGIDVHEFEPSPAAIQAIAKANILILNGVGLEPWASARHSRS